MTFSMGRSARPNYALLETNAGGGMPVRAATFAPDRSRHTDAAAAPAIFWMQRNRIPICGDLLAGCRRARGSGPDDDKLKGSDSTAALGSHCASRLCELRRSPVYSERIGLDCSARVTLCQSLVRAIVGATTIACIFCRPWMDELNFSLPRLPGGLLVVQSGLSFSAFSAPFVSSQCSKVPKWGEA
jgi:hypothetical protein